MSRKSNRRSDHSGPSDSNHEENELDQYEGINEDEPESAPPPPPGSPRLTAVPCRLQRTPRNDNPAVLPDIWMLFDTTWNDEQLTQRDLPLTSNLGKECDSQAALADILKAVMPSTRPRDWSIFHLQSSQEAIEARITSHNRIQRLVNENTYYVPDRSQLEWVDNSRDPQYITKPEPRNGVLPLLYEIIGTQPRKLYAQAVNPLVYLHGTEYLRVVSLKRSVAREVMSGCLGYPEGRVTVGEHLWVYKMGLTDKAASDMKKHGLDLRHYPSQQYLDNVKCGNTPRTLFQILEFAHATPHTPMVTRLARALPLREKWDNKKNTWTKSTTHTVVIEGEIKTTRLKPEAMSHISNRTDSNVFLVKYRPLRASLPHFSAPAINIGALGDIVEMLRRDRDNLSLRPDDRIEVAELIVPSRSIVNIVTRKTDEDKVRLIIKHTPSQSIFRKRISTKPEKLELNESVHDHVEILKLGESALRYEEWRRMDSDTYHPTIQIKKRARTHAENTIVMIELESTSKDRLKNGWTDLGRKVFVRRSARDDWAIGHIFDFELSIYNTTVWLRFDTSLPDIPNYVEVEVKLDRISHNPMLDRMLGKDIRFLPGSFGEQIMQRVYRRILDKGNEVKTLPPVQIAIERPPAASSPCFVWSDEQWQVVVRGADESLLILHVDSGAGTGKTSAIAGSIDYTLRNSNEKGTLILAIAVTKIAVAALADKIEAFASPATKITRLSGDHERFPCKTDLVQQIIDCASNSDAPAKMAKIGKDLAASVAELRELRQESEKSKRDEIAKDIGTAERMLKLSDEIEQARAALTKEFLDFRQHNVLALTLTSLNNAMANETSIWEYIQRAKKLIVWVDEASQAPEIALPSISEMLPNAYQRYVGDSRQLPPHWPCLVESVDTRLAGSVAVCLSSSANTPTLRLRHCHRMHPALLKVPSSLFYADTLVTSFTEADRTLDPSIRIPDRSLPLCVITTDGAEREAEIGYSLANEFQERLAITLVRNVLAPAYGSVAVLSFYRESVDRMRKIAPDVNATTVDSSQGAEFDVIVILTTKSKPPGTMKRHKDEHRPNIERKHEKVQPRSSFIGCRRRVNVALTRARRAIFVIGHDEILPKYAEWWHTILSIAQEKGNVLTEAEAREKIHPLISSESPRRERQAFHSFGRI